MDNKLDINYADIDKEVLEIISQEKVEKLLSDEKLFNRAMLNAYAEMLSELKKVKDLQEQFVQVITILSSSKLKDFFTNAKEKLDK